MISVYKLFEEQVEKHPDKLLYSFLDINGKVTESYNYQGFYQRVSEIAGQMHRVHNLQSGERVLLAYPPGLEMMAVFFACVRIGLIPVPVYPPAAHGFQSALYKMTFIAKDCGASSILTCRKYYWSMKINQTRNKFSTFSFKTDYITNLKWIITDDAGPKDVVSFEAKPSPILFLQYTSGSTNDPKGVIVTHQNLIHNANLVVDHTPVGVSWLPQYHDMGLIGYYLFFALKSGTTYGFSPLDFIQRPALWLETISKYRGTASSAPNFAYAFCLKPGKIPEDTLSQLDLSSLRFLMTAAEPVRANIFEQFITKFEPYGLQRKSLFSAYGLAEFTLAVSNYGRTTTLFNTTALGESTFKLHESIELEGEPTALVSCGKPLGDTELRIVDGSTFKELEHGKVGEIWIDGQSKCLGYWNRPELTKEIFQATIPGDPQQKLWLRTGDLGFIHNGELYVCGRVKDLIIIRGSNYYPHDIECAVEEHTFRKGCVAAFSIEKSGGEVLVIVGEVKDSKMLPDARQVNEQLLRQLGIEAETIVCIAPRSIPKTSSGKIVRHLAKKQFLENKLKTIAVLSTQSDINVNGSTLDQLFKSYQLQIQTKGSLGEIGFDSIRLAEFAHDIKEYLEKHGFQDLTVPIEVSYIQKIPIFKLYKILSELRSSSPASKLKFKQAFIELQQEQKRAIVGMMKRDIDDWNQLLLAPVIENHENTGEILLTGGTGFFGPFLLKSLLEQQDDIIYVLVRACDEQEGKTRLRNAFATIAPSPIMQDKFEEKVRVKCGDLTQPCLGLSNEQWNYLAQNIHTIYHNGAAVNYLFDYEAMRTINVQGTKEIVRLAGTSRIKVLNHISTTFIFGWSVKETLFESDNNDEMELLDFGYSQSKWVSERTVMQARNQGLPVRIFRPALISPSVSGDGFNFDISIRLLAFMLKHGITTSAQNQVSFTPADIAANNIVAISNLEQSIGLTFHVTLDEHASMYDITELFTKLTGKIFKSFSLHDFVPEVVNRCTKRDLLFPLLNFLVRSIDNIKAMEFKKYDNTNYVKYRSLSPYGIADPSLEDVVAGILSFMQKQGIAELTEEVKHVKHELHERTATIA